ncbi:MAG: adenylyl-sulfate kinase [Saprospiraceae bacterium]|nr:adenylyl-sulfate kinase [Saprospiraceae bacterium]
MNIHPIHETMLSRVEREQALGQHSKVLWLTGYSGSGKSTIAVALERLLFQAGLVAQVLDGDNIRSGINSNLGFSLADRQENIRRIAEVAKLYVHSGLVCICSFISPTVKMRQSAADIIGADDFLEIFIDTPLYICEQRDVKGLYKKARAGEITGFTGIDSPYEAPIDPALTIKTENQTIDESTAQIFAFVSDLLKLQQ